MNDAGRINRFGRDGRCGGKLKPLDSNAVLRLVASSERSAYDCELVALAQRLRCKLVTMDKKILHIFPEVALALTDFAH